MNKFKKIIWPSLSLLVAVGIFYSSAATGEVSGAASMAIAEYVHGIAERFLNIAPDTLNFFVRKAAHFAVYFALAFCVAMSLKPYVKNTYFLLLAAWGIATVYGITDEIHQYFVPGRVAAISDMLINSAGALTASALVSLLRKPAVKGDNLPR